MLAIFLTYERRLAGRGGEPVFDPALLGIRAFAIGLSASVLFFGGLGSYFLTLSVYLQNGTDRTAWETGLVILPYALGWIITSGLGVAFAAKAGRALLITGSLTIAASQLVLWAVIRDGNDPGYWHLALALFVGGLGLGLAAERVPGSPWLRFLSSSLSVRRSAMEPRSATATARKSRT
ncbi:hypothetical protein SVIOM74S_01546 [Streptomyces violarus]